MRVCDRCKKTFPVHFFDEKFCMNGGQAAVGLHFELCDHCFKSLVSDLKLLLGTEEFKKHADFILEQYEYLKTEKVQVLPEGFFKEKK